MTRRTGRRRRGRPRRLFRSRTLIVRLTERKNETRARNRERDRQIDRRTDRVRTKGKENNERKKQNETKNDEERRRSAQSTNRATDDRSLPFRGSSERSFCTWLSHSSSLERARSEVVTWCCCVLLQPALQLPKFPILDRLTPAAPLRDPPSPPSDQPPILSQLYGRSTVSDTVRRSSASSSSSAGGTRFVPSDP